MKYRLSQKINFNCEKNSSAPGICGILQILKAFRIILSWLCKDFEGWTRIAKKIFTKKIYNKK